jgi:hypothetical protein
MTKIEFTDEHLRVMMTALEVYSRLRSGQIKIAIETAYSDYSITGNESETIENYVRDIVFPRTFALEQNHKEAYDEQCRVKRPALNKNSYFGVTSSEMLKSGGTLAHEIYSTLRQYVSLKNNDGYEGSGVNYYSPLMITQVPLPVIEGFSGSTPIGMIEKEFVAATAPTTVELTLDEIAAKFGVNVKDLKIKK